jgi:polysaccharide export outer membrane protein
MRIYIAVAMLAALPTVFAQERLPASGTPAGANLPAQPAGEGDLLAVTVYGAPELTRSVRVSPEGSIRLPMLEHAMEVRGLMPEQIEGRIALALAGEQILVDPVVTVTLAEIASRPIRVAGSVRRPVTFQADGRTTLLDALSRAEGLAPEAGHEILVTYPAAAGQPALTTRVLVKDLLENADPGANLALAGGEEVRVPEVGRVFVVGNVTKPGGFPMADANGMSVMKALALAEGLSPFAAKVAYVYRPGEGAKLEVPIELRKIMDRKNPDVELRAGDILYIPDNRRSRMTANVLDKVISFAAGTASGALVLSVGRR